jgi:type IV pilus assembly protein PilC
MEFHCRIATPTGQITEGLYAAESEVRLRHDLEEKGLYVLQVRRRGALALGALAVPRRRKIGTREFVVFNQELATLLKAGMPLVQSLDILRRRVENPTLKAVLDDVHQRVRAGSALSEAFEAQEELFPGIYTASLLAGEKSGNLDQVIRRYISYVKIISTVRRRTFSALVYPALLVLLSLAVITIIIVKVVPSFETFYAGFQGAQLPASTRMIIAFSSAVTRNLPLVAFGALVLAGATWAWMRQPGRRAQIDRLILGLPGIGPIARKFATSQLTRTLATLIGGGIPLVNALDIAARSSGNRYMALELSTVAQRVREGEGMAVALGARGVFPDVAVKMVEVGESTGALQEMLNSVADFFDEEIDTSLGRFVTLVEPVLLVVMGVVIAALLLALYLPLFQLSSVL